MMLPVCAALWSGSGLWTPPNPAANADTTSAGRCIGGSLRSGDVTGGWYPSGPTQSQSAYGFGFGVGMPVSGLAVRGTPAVPEPSGPPVAGARAPAGMRPVAPL